jgi:N-acetylneuraminate synthase
MDEVFLIGEAGINHNGEVEVAKKLIDNVKKHKWNAIKFQKRTVEKVIPKKMWDVKKETPWGLIKYIQYKKNLEFGKKQYDEIDEYCRDVGVDWFASAWDLDSQIFLDKYDLKYNKIASPMIAHEKLLKHVSEQGKLTFISTGMSTFEDIDKAVEIFEKNTCPFILMHCVGLYPCPLHKLNLRMIETLRNRYNREIGYSGHSEGAFDAVIATVLGASHIEKHITLNRAMFGSDQSASLESGGMGFISKHCRHIPIMMGHGKKVISDKEENVSYKLRYWTKW